MVLKKKFTIPIVVLVLAIFSYLIYSLGHPFKFAYSSARATHWADPIKVESTYWTEIDGEEDLTKLLPESTKSLSPKKEKGYLFIYKGTFYKKPRRASTYGLSTSNEEVKTYKYVWIINGTSYGFGFMDKLPDTTSSQHSFRTIPLVSAMFTLTKPVLDSWD